MKRNGFTIIEMLASLIVISILLFIAVPTVIQMVEEARRGAFTNSVYGIMKAVELDSSKTSQGRNAYALADGILTFSGETINYKGEIIADGILEINDKGRVALVLGNASWCAKKTFNSESVTVTNGACDNVNVLPIDDVTKPVITLNGTTPVNLNVGASYTDDDATVTDNVDANRQLSGTGSVNTSIPGTYTITFNTTDVAGNVADTVTRTVIVSDVVSPVITLNGTNPVDINLGDSYIDLGATVTDDVDADRQISGTGSVNVNAVGSYTITFNTTDSSGNAATQVTRTVNVVSSFIVNAPLLTAPMIPIEWDGTKWVKADSDWYDYDAKKWANVVITTPASRAGYQAASAGTDIIEADVLMYLVWIPRYKFAVPTGSGPREISIVFENGTATTGTGTGTATDDYLTHPGFTFNASPLRGLWAGKFDSGKTQPGAFGTWTTAGAQGGAASNLLIIKPNIYSWRGMNVSTEYNVAKWAATDSNYGIETGFNTHMSSNLEWGTISFLAHSKYGLCTGGVCNNIWINPSSSYMTGCAGASADAAGTAGCPNTYETTNGVKASTTNNVYGVYDLSGGAYEHTFAHWTNYAGSSGFTTAFLGGAEAAKYINKYTTGTVLIGDSGKGNPTQQWYGDVNVSMMLNSINAFCRRGGSYDATTGAGLFYYESAGGAASNYGGFRFIITEDL